MSATTLHAQPPVTGRVVTRHPKRADARRNAEAILDAALVCLSRDADASISEIATAAGVGRVTLYGHYPSRADLLDAVLARALEQAERAVATAAELPPADPRQALGDLVSASWQQIVRFRRLLAATQHALPPERRHARHDRVFGRVELLIAGGQRCGVFRRDMPTSWLVALFYSALHTAAAEIGAGRLAVSDAPRTVTATLLAAYAPTGRSGQAA